jgi:hypothetical protein
MDHFIKTAAPPRRGAPFVARRAVNLHGCALPHCAPLLRRLRRTLLSRAPSMLSWRYVTVVMKRNTKVAPFVHIADHMKGST